MEEGAVLKGEISSLKPCIVYNIFKITITLLDTWINVILGLACSQEIHWAFCKMCVCSFFRIWWGVNHRWFGLLIFSSFDYPKATVVIYWNIFNFNLLDLSLLFNLNTKSQHLQTVLRSWMYFDLKLRSLI